MARRTVPGGTDPEDDENTFDLQGDPTEGPGATRGGRGPTIGPTERGDPTEGPAVRRGGQPDMGERDVRRETDRLVDAQDRDLAGAQDREKVTPDDDPDAVDRAAMDGAEPLSPDGRPRTTAQSPEEKRARSDLVDRSPLIDLGDVEFRERDGRTFATVDEETARLLGASGFNPDADLVAVRPGPSRSGGEDVGVPGGGAPFGLGVDVDLGSVEDATLGPQPVEGADLPGARGQVEQSLEEQIGGGVDLKEGDIEFSEVDTEDGTRVSGGLSRSGRKKVAVSRAPGGDLPFVGDEIEAVAGVDFELREEARQRRDRFLFDDPLDDVRIDVDVPSVEAEDVLGAAAAAAPLAVAEPSPVGEVVVGGTLLAGGALLAAEALEDDRLPPADLSAVADVPEVGLPEDPSQPFFKRDVPVGPTSIDLPELLAPTAERSTIDTGRFTPPEIEVTEDVDRFVPEFDVPDDPPGKTRPELEVPTAETAQLAEPKQVERPERKEVEVPEGMLPSEEVTIGGGVGSGIGEAGRELGTGGGAMGITVRDDPRSTELERIVTGRGVEVELGADLTRFLRSDAAALDVSDVEAQLLEQGTGTRGTSLLAGGVDLDAQLADVGASIDAELAQPVDLDQPTTTDFPTADLTEPVEATAVSEPVEFLEDFPEVFTTPVTPVGAPGGAGRFGFDLDLDGPGEEPFLRDLDAFDREFAFERDLGFIDEAGVGTLDFGDLDAIDADFRRGGGGEPWHTTTERRAIESRGGTWSGSGEPGVDGEIGGRPVEVRSSRAGGRYRIGKSVHDELVADDGLYIFTDDERGSTTVPADELTVDLSGDQWYEDRSYPHRFADVDDVFGGGAQHKGPIGIGDVDILDDLDADLDGL